MMKKNLLFFIPMLIISVLLFLLHMTGMPIHMIVSVIGLLVLVVSAVKTKKEWTCPLIEIIERVFYAIALITGIVIINVRGVEVVSVIHKISAVAFVLLLIVNAIRKK